MKRVGQDGKIYGYAHSLGIFAKSKLKSNFFKLLRDFGIKAVCGDIHDQYGGHRKYAKMKNGQQH